MAITGLIADKNMNPITDPSPIDVVEDLKNLDDNTLAQYAQDRGNPNATYALVVLMQRKKARDTARQDRPQGTVAQEVAQDVTTGGITQPAPNPEQLTSMGVGALPAPNVGQNYAEGGIVAFQDGGDVAFPQSYSQMYPSLDVIGSGLGGVFSYLNPYSYGDKLVTDPVTGKVTRVPKESRFKTMREKMEKELMEERLRRSQEKKSIAEKQEELVKGQRGVVDPKLAEYEGDRSMMESLSDKPTLAELEGESVFKGEAGIDPEMNAVIDEVSKEQGKGVDLLGEADRLENKYARDRIDDKSAEDYFKEVDDAYSRMGVDRGIFSDMQADLKRDREQLGKAKGEAADIALIEAGLLIAGGKSQNALSNLGEAAPAIRNYANERRSLRSEERAIRDAEFKIKAADVAARQGQADKALAMMMDNRKLQAQIDISKLDRDSREKVAQINRSSYERIAELTNSRPSDFERQVALAKESGQYTKKDEEGNDVFDFQAFYNDYKGAMGRRDYGTVSADEVLKQYNLMGGMDVLGIPFNQYYANLQAGAGGFVPSEAQQSLVNKYLGI